MTGPPLWRVRAAWMSRRGLEQVAELTGRDAEQVVAVHHDGELWVVDVDVVEVHRVPETTDVMATVRVRLDEDGEVFDLERTSRWVRSKR